MNFTKSRENSKTGLEMRKKMVDSQNSDNFSFKKMSPDDLYLITISFKTPKSTEKIPKFV